MANTEIKLNLKNLSDTEREQLMKLVKKANKPRMARPRAEKGQGYLYINYFGEIDFTSDLYTKCDDIRYKSGNYYLTEKEAETRGVREFQKRIIHQKIKDFAMLHNDEGYEFDFNKRNYFIKCYYDLFETKTTFVAILCTGVKPSNTIFFSSEEVCQACINSLTEEELKLYFDLD